MFNIPVRPDGIDIRRPSLKQDAGIEGKWDRIYEKTFSVVDSITIHNDTTQTIWIAMKENPNAFEYDPLAPKSYMNIEANPKVIYAKRTTNPPAGTSSPAISTITTYFTEEQIAEIMAFWSKSMLSVFGVFNPTAAQAASTIKSKVTETQSIIMSPSDQEGAADINEAIEDTLPKPKVKFWNPFSVLDSLFGGGK